MHENTGHANIRASEQNHCKGLDMNVRDFVEHYKGTWEFRDWEKEHKYYKSKQRLIDVVDEICHGNWQTAYMTAENEAQKRNVIAGIAAVEGDTVDEDDIAAVMSYCAAFNTADFDSVREFDSLEDAAEESFFRRYEKEYGRDVQVLPAGWTHEWLYEVESC